MDSSATLAKAIKSDPTNRARILQISANRYLGIPRKKARTPSAPTERLMNSTDMWTDGACWPNPGGPGAYAAISTFQGEEITTSGFEAISTNNRMEITAAIEGLKALKGPSRVTIYSDSQYLVNSMTRNWRKMKNQDLWVELDKLCQVHRVKWKWVRGHDGNVMNERCDLLANQELVNRGFRDGSRRGRK